MSLIRLPGSPSARPLRRAAEAREPQAAEVLEDRVLLTPSPDRPEDITGFQNGRWVTSLGTTDRSSAQPFTSQWDKWANVAWNYVGEGDFNADGLTDVIGLYQGGWYVALSTGSSYSRFLDGRASLWAQWNPSVTWQDVRIADLNGDGRSDIFARFGNTFYAAVANPTSTAFTFTTGTGAWATTGGLTFQALFLADVGNPNGTAAADGQADLVGFTTGGNWVASLSTGASFANLALPSQPFWTLGTAWNNAASWQGLTTADMNSDGLQDVVGFRNGQWQVGLSTGTSFSTVQRAQWAAVSNWQDARIGDFDGNGVLDIAARIPSGQYGLWYVGLTSLPNGSNGAAVVNTTYWGFWSNQVTWQDVRVGDFDGDGADDIAGRYHTQWYVGYTTFSAEKNGLLFATQAFANWSAWGTGGVWLAVATVQANNLPPAGGGGALMASETPPAATAPAQQLQEKESLSLFWARSSDDELEWSL